MLDIKEYNCGGLAFGTWTWYKPYADNIEVEELFANYYYKGIEDCDGDWENLESLDDTYVYVLNEMEEQIYKDFPGKVRPLYGDVESLLLPGENLVALRVGAHLDEDFEIDADFHFRVLVGGIWLDKPGAEPIRTIVGAERDAWNEPWEYAGNIYDSEIRYFAVRRY